MNMHTEVEFCQSVQSTPCDRMALLFADLAGARGEFDEIPRNRLATIRMKSGGSYSYKYADLADILRAVDPALSAYGIGLHQEPTPEGVVTTLYHKAGGVLRSSPWPIKPMPQRGIDDAQSYQSAVQVAKRYSLQSALGISSEESLEGTDSRKVGGPRNSTDTTVDASFQGEDGFVGVKGVTVDKDASPREKAEAYADGIIKAMDAAKTERGVNGAWNRNQQFIDRFAEDYTDLYQDVLDAYQSSLEAFKGETE